MFFPSSVAGNITKTSSGGKTSVSKFEEYELREKLADELFSNQEYLKVSTVKVIRFVFRSPPLSFDGLHLLQGNLGL
jgi:hypothetical protein